MKYRVAHADFEVLVVRQQDLHHVQDVPRVHLLLRQQQRVHVVQHLDDLGDLPLAAVHERNVLPEVAQREQLQNHRVYIPDALRVRNPHVPVLRLLLQLHVFHRVLRVHDRPLLVQLLLHDCDVVDVGLSGRVEHVFAFSVFAHEEEVLVDPDSIDQVGVEERVSDVDFENILGNPLVVPFELLHLASVHVNQEDYQVRSYLGKHVRQIANFLPFAHPDRLEEH